jgi:hypothetical protein
VKNADYPNDDPVVDVAVVRYLDEEAIENGEVKYYTYPVSRLKRLEVHTREAKAEATIEKMKIVGQCVNCEESITSKNQQYVEGADGRIYCSIGCHNEEVNR